VLSPGSGVARVTCALGHPLDSTKLLSFYVKNRCKVQKKQKQNIYCRYFVPFLGQLNIFSARNELNKSIIV